MIEETAEEVAATERKLACAAWRMDGISPEDFNASPKAVRDSLVGLSAKRAEYCKGI